MLTGALVTLFAPMIFNRIEGGRGRVRHEAMKGFGAEFLDAVQGLPTLKAFGQSRSYGVRLAERARYLSETTMKVLSTSVMTRGITDAGVAIGAAAALALGVYRVSHGETTIQALLIVLMCGTEVYRPLRDLRSVLHQGLLEQSAAAGIDALFAAEPAGAPPQAPVRSAAAAPSLPDHRLRSGRFRLPWRGRGKAHDGLEAFGRGGRKDRHRRTERIGEIVGRLAPATARCSTCNPAGRIMVGGADIRTLRPGGIAQPDRGRPSGTLLPVPRHRRGEPSPRQSGGEPGPDRRGCARRQRAHEFIARMPQGYEIEEMPRRARRHALGRAAAAPGDCPRAIARFFQILILDEGPVLGRHTENEAVIQEAIDRLARDRTTLILAHRLSSVIGADRILVLDHGKVVEVGTYAELIRRDGPYLRLMGARKRRTRRRRPGPGQGDRRGGPRRRERCDRLR